MQYARRMFDRAIEIDPNFARAHAGIADCCSFLYMYWDASNANLEEADASSRKALQLDPSTLDQLSWRPSGLSSLVCLLGGCAPDALSYRARVFSRARSHR